MNTNRECGCKGHRSCLTCEQLFDIKPIKQTEAFSNVQYYNINGDNSHLERLGFSGLQIIPDFISEAEEVDLVQQLDLLTWDKSQSGRRKQNFGPKANFKKRKTKVGNFEGFPSCTKFIQDRFEEVGLLEGYRTVEQCSIEYTAHTGACIEPHIDDCWIWGERIVQLNLLSSTYLSLVPYNGDTSKYNLQDVKSYPRVVENDKVVFNPFRNSDSNETNTCFKLDTNHRESVLIKVPLPPRSLLIMYGKARYEWEHMILREDITARRIIIAYREFTPPYLNGGHLQDVGREILSKAEKFWQIQNSDQNQPVENEP